MTQDHKPEKEESVAEQKKRLLQQCDAYRNGIGRSRKVVAAHLGQGELAKTVIGLVSTRAHIALNNFSSMFDLKSFSGDALQRLLPLAVSGVSLLAKRSVWRSLARGAVVAGIGATVVYFSSRKKKSAHEKHVALREHL